MRLGRRDGPILGTARLVGSAWHKPPALSPLADNPDDLDRLAHLESLTSGRLAAERDGLPDLDAREFAFSARERTLRTWGDVAVNAAFAYRRRDGNRFNDGRRGAWYCATDPAAALEEAAFHKTRELLAAEWLHETSIHVELLADFLGPFPDLHGVRPPPPCLAADPETAYPLGQALARELRAGGARGLAYPSARASGGGCLVAFEPQIVQNVRLGARWELAWDGAPRHTARPA